MKIALIIIGIVLILSAAGVFSYKWQAARKKKKALAEFMKKMGYDKIGYA